MDTNDDHIARSESEIRYLKGLRDENGIPYDYETIAMNVMQSSISPLFGTVA